MLTQDEGEIKLANTLATAGLGRSIEFWQFLDLPDNYFTEIVLKDGSRLPEAHRVVRKFIEGIEGAGAKKVESIVRAVWKLVSVVPIGPVRSPDGGLTCANRFVAKLVSGNATCEVSVDVTHSANEIIHRRLAEKSHPAKGRIPTTEEETVRTFLERELSYGGDRYRDPLKYSHFELTEDAIWHLWVFGLN
jgi:hypothetical protein